MKREVRDDRDKPFSDGSLVKRWSRTVREGPPAVVVYVKPFVFFSLSCKKHIQTIPCQSLISPRPLFLRDESTLNVTYSTTVHEFVPFPDLHSPTTVSSALAPLSTRTGDTPVSRTGLACESSTPGPSKGPGPLCGSG